MVSPMANPRRRKNQLEIKVLTGTRDVPLQPTARGFWKQLLGSCGDLGKATRQLIHQFHTCLFGTYRCHQRRQPLQAA